jgi:hypothetical protein
MLNYKLGMFGLVFGCALSSAACGGAYDGDLQFGTSVRGEEVPCGAACPETCWVELFDSGNQYGQWWVFNADERPEQQLRDAVATLSIPGVSPWIKQITDVVADPVQETVYGSWTIAGTFDISDDDMIATIDMGSPGPTLTCGFRVN